MQRLGLGPEARRRKLEELCADDAGGGQRNVLVQRLGLGPRVRAVAAQGHASPSSEGGADTARCELVCARWCPETAESVVHGAGIARIRAEGADTDGTCALFFDKERLLSLTGVP